MIDLPTLHQKHTHPGDDHMDSSLLPLFCVLFLSFHVLSIAGRLDVKFTKNHRWNQGIVKNSPILLMFFAMSINMSLYIQYSLYYITMGLYNIIFRMTICLINNYCTSR